MKNKTLRCFALLALIMLFRVGGVQALQPLPDLYDLLVVISSAPGNNLDTVVRVNTSTWEQALFYTTGDPGLAVYPLEWSPGGSLLAVVLLDIWNHDVPSWWTPVSMCILTRDGALYRCMDEPAAPQIYLWDENLSRDAFPVTWSPDERRIYYLTADLEDHERVTLIEVDVETGQMTRELATYTSTDDNTPSIAWPSDLHMVILGGLSWNPRDSILMDAATGTSSHLRDIDERIWDVCPRFSPDGHYFVTRASDGGLLVLDQHVQTVAVVEPVIDRQRYFFGCPAWSVDGQYLYFIGETEWNVNTTIFRYSLAARRTSVFVRVNVEGSYLVHSRSRMVIEVSPNGRRVALPMLESYAIFPHVAVLDEHGVVQSIAGEAMGADAPLWIPPLQTSTPGS